MRDKQLESDKQERKPRMANPNTKAMVETPPKNGHEAELPRASAADLRKAQAEASGSTRYKNKTYYSDDVQLRLINLIYDPLAQKLFAHAGIDPDEAHLLGLTRINSSREAMYWAQQIAKEAAFNKYVRHIECDWPISQVQRIAFMLARRSIPGECGPAFMAGVQLANEQAIQKEEQKAGEPVDW